MEESIQFFTAPLAPKNPYFYILNPSWNNLSYQQLCIAAIRKHSTTSFEIILHLNEANDGSKEWVESQKDIAFSYSSENVGVCYAMNAMVKLAHSDYFLYLNDDMYVLPNWDGFLKEEIVKIGHTEFFLSATAIEPKAQSACSIQADYGRSLATFEEERLLKTYASLPFEDWHGATWPPNVVHRSLWDKVGGYSNEFSPGMYSDPDFSMKCWQEGVRLFKGISRSRVYHFGSISVKRVKQNKGYYQFIRKWGMTSSTLSKYYLRRGEKFDGTLVLRSIPLTVHLKNLYYRLSLPFRKQK
jgi:glycosyltransferase involved in cell wall biosynthesis